MTIDRPLTEGCLIPHRAFQDALSRLDQCYQFAERKIEAEGMAIVGESGTGKTSVLRTFLDKHRSKRETEGMTIPVLYVTVPSSPTVKSLAAVILEALHAPDPDRGTENEKTRRIRVLICETEVRVILIDEFQHFFDRGTHKVMHSVADWLKILIDSTRTTLVVAGLPSCLAVTGYNEQLRRRLSGHVRLSRFDWRVTDQRAQFIDVLESFHGELQEAYDLPQLHSDGIAFRMWQATGGLIGYLAKLIRQVERNAIVSGVRVITLRDLDRAHHDAIWVAQCIPDLPRPFANRSAGEPTEDIYNSIDQIGRVMDHSYRATRALRSAPRRESLDRILSK